MKEILQQLMALRARVDSLHGQAEKALETLESRPTSAAEQLEEQTEELERLESILECLDEAMHHCQG